MNKFDSPLAAFLHWEAAIPDNVFLNQPLNGHVKKRTYKSGGAEIRRIAAALKALDIPEKSKIAILSKNCAEWILADLAIMMAGHISVPIYPTVGAETIRLILDHSESKAIFVGKLDNYKEQKSGIPDIYKIGIKAYDVHEELSWEEISRIASMRSSKQLLRSQSFTQSTASSCMWWPRMACQTLKPIRRCAVWSRKPRRTRFPVM